MSEHTLYPYLVTFIAKVGAGVPEVFRCQAEDAEHAVEQARDEKMVGRITKVVREDADTIARSAAKKRLDELALAGALDSVLDLLTPSQISELADAYYEGV